MKKIFNLIVVSLLALIPLQHIQAKKSSFQYNVSVWNGTGVNCSFAMYGPTSHSGTLYPGHNNFNPVDPGTYTVYMYSPAGIERTYNFNGIHITNSTGSATFNNVSVTGNCNAAIYQ